MRKPDGISWSGSLPSSSIAPRGEPDLLFRLPQRRLLAARVPRLRPPAGKADLAGVIVQMRRALGEQHLYAFGAAHERHQHRGRHDARFGLQRHQMLVLRRRVRRGAAAFQRCFAR